MGSRMLVTKEQAASGKKLLQRLPAGGVDVVGAAWVQADDDGQPYLYIVSPTYDAAGPLEATGLLGRVHAEVNKGVTDPFDRVDPFEVKLVSPRDPVARGIVQHYQRHPDDQPTFHYGSVLGGVPIEGAYIYPATMFTAPAAPPA